MAKLSKRQKIRRFIFLLTLLAILIYGVTQLIKIFVIEESKNEAVQTHVLKQLERDGKTYLNFDEVNDTFAINATYTFDEPNRTVTVFDGKHKYEMLLGQTQVSRNGLYLPIDATPFVDSKTGKLWITQTFWRQCLGIVNKQSGAYRSNEWKQSFDSLAVFYQPKEIDLAQTDTESLVQYLSFMKNPIPGAQLSTRDNHLPGAPRTYRNGVHEGIDFYSGYTNMPIDRNTKVLSVADGVVVRIDSDYREMSVVERNTLLEVSARAKITPTYILDKLRGRSVWVQYEKGLLIRYAHMGTLNPALKIGSTVEVGEWVGNVGNSGTDQGALNTDGDLHLHMDMLLYGELFWQHLSRADIRLILGKIF
jgi:murein DD-endopeptidase MepM/ murein hydrolase activator NlpD